MSWGTFMHCAKRFLRLCFLVTLVGFAPMRAAHADATLSVSLGYGQQLSPTSQTESTNLMVAPGFGIGNLLRLELGILGALEGSRPGSDSGLGLQFRPMLVISPPLLPVFARLIVAAVDPFSVTRTFAYGGAIGVVAALSGVGLFLEAGVLPRAYNSYFAWVLEGRAGVYLNL